LPRLDHARLIIFKILGGRLMMAGIVCAIRGGPDSQPTIGEGITLALREKLPLYFLYIVNLDFLSYTSSSRTQAITKEMQQMGEFILLAAQASADAKGVSAQGLVRQGNVMEEIAGACHELKADFLVLGSPKGQQGESIFSEERLAKFIEWAEQQTGAQVVLVGGNDS
jgi:nucleotide-binding universal stress UspA family protein